METEFVINSRSRLQNVSDPRNIFYCHRWTTQFAYEHSALMLQIFIVTHSSAAPISRTIMLLSCAKKLNSLE